MQSTEQFTWDQFTSVGVFLDFGSLRIYEINENLGVCFFSLLVRGDPKSSIGHSGQEQNTHPSFSVLTPFPIWTD